MVFSAWSWLFAILGFAMRLLRFDRPWLRHANEGVLPFYILHQTVLLGIGFFVMRWEIHDVLKWAIEFYSGANQLAESQPMVYVDLRFSAPAGRYTIWIRGKSDVYNDYTDSVWLQADETIGTRVGSVRLGNWLDIHPVGIYAWQVTAIIPLPSN